MQKDYIEVIDEVINNLVLEVEVYSVTDDGPFYTMYVTNTHQLNKGSVFVYNNISYKVIDFIQNMILKVVGAEMPTKGKFTLPNPLFKFGKYSQILVEIARENKSGVVLWAVEPQQRRYYSNWNSALYSSGEVRLFLVNDSNWEDFSSSDHRREVLLPMKQLWERIFNDIKNHHLVSRITTQGRIITHSKMTTSAGLTNGKELLGRRYSGLEIFVDLPIYKDTCAKTRILPPLKSKLLTINGKLLVLNSKMLAYEFAKNN